MPTPPTTNTCSDLLNKPLTGWEEIRYALTCIEEMRRSGNGSARVDVTDQSTRSSVSVSLRTVAELEEYVKSRFRFSLLEGSRGSLALDDTKKTVREEIVLGQVKME